MDVDVDDLFSVYEHCWKWVFQGVISSTPCPASARLCWSLQTQTKQKAEIFCSCFWSLLWHACVLVICQAGVMSALNGCHLGSATGPPCFWSWADSPDASQSWTTGTLSWNMEDCSTRRRRGSPVKLCISVTMTELQWCERQTDPSSLEGRDDRWHCK